MGYNVFTGNREYSSDGVAGVVATLNPHSYVLNRKDDDFRKALTMSNYLLPDGVGISLSARVLEGEKLKSCARADMRIFIIKALDNRCG